MKISGTWFDPSEAGNGFQITKDPAAFFCSRYIETENGKDWWVANAELKHNNATYYQIFGDPSHVISVQQTGDNQLVIRKHENLTNYSPFDPTKELPIVEEWNCQRLVDATL